MVKFSWVVGFCWAALFVPVDPAFAQKRVEYNKGSAKDLEIPQCGQPLGTLSVRDGDGRAWLEYELGAPSTLLKVFVSRSNCFKLVDRGVGLSALQEEQALAAGGSLQGRSNVGGGQVKAADYVLIADIASGNQNAKGSTAGAVAGAVIGGPIGGLIGGFRSKRAEAQTVLTLMNVRTSEVEATTEGFASKKDIGFGVGGGAFGGGVLGAAGGGGYTNTEIGKVVTWAFLDAYRQMVTQLGLLSGDAAGDAPKESFVVRVDTADLRRSPSASSSVVRVLERGMVVYPTGAKEDLWWEVEDENGNAGWVDNTLLQQAG
ncbi:MAG TPA: curli production assembly/transport component csgg [Hyphomonadaceae bacterium]|nr:curli production assembly/transport component csgg [Hyphomonadaceae bacterium]